MNLMAVGLVEIRCGDAFEGGSRYAEPASRRRST